MLSKLKVLRKPLTSIFELSRLAHGHNEKILRCYNSYIYKKEHSRRNVLELLLSLAGSAATAPLRLGIPF